MKLFKIMVMISWAKQKSVSGSVYLRKGSKVLIMGRAVTFPYLTWQTKKPYSGMICNGYCPAYDQDLTTY